MEDGNAGVELHCHAGFGAQEVDAGQETVGLFQLRQQRAQAVAESEQDALHFVALVELQLAQVVPQLHHLAGFDKGGEACGALVLDEAAYLAAMGGK